MYRIDFSKEVADDLRGIDDAYKADAAEVFRIFQNASGSSDVNKTLLTMGKYAGYEVKIYKEQIDNSRYIFILKAYRDEENSVSIDIRTFFCVNDSNKIVYVLGFLLRNDDTYEADNGYTQRICGSYDKFCSDQ